MVKTAEMPLTELIKILPNFDPYRDAEGYYFDEAAAEKAVFWIENCCTFTKGEWAKKPLVLEPFQKATVANLFGWKSEKDDTRRFREVFFYVARKNGKTEIAGAIILYVFFCDGEFSAELYSAAAESDQAKIVWDVSRRMIENRPDLFEEYCKVYTKSIAHYSTDSFYKYISADANTKHGFGAHVAILDEVHAQADEELSDVLETSMGSRRQPIMIYLTTADFDRPSLCNNLHNRAKKVLSGEIKDPRLLPVVFEADREDDWKSPETWKKANPNYGISIKEDYFLSKFNKALTTPSFENTFKRLHLNMKTEQARRWLQLHMWDKSCNEYDRKEMLEKLKGRPAWCGLDLSSTIDTTSLVLIFPLDGFVIIPFFWVPEDSADAKEKSDKVPYKQWEKDGLVEFTPGNRIDYSFIEHKIVELSEDYELMNIGFDPWNAAQTALHLSENEGLPMTQVRQGYVSMNEPSKRFESDVATGKLNHGHHPIMRWMAGNVAVREDPAGNLKPDKHKSADKIDGIVALIIAYAVFLQEDDPEGYDDYDLRVIGD